MKFEKRGNRYFDLKTGEDVTLQLAREFRIREAKSRGGSAKTKAKKAASRKNAAIARRNKSK